MTDLYEEKARAKGWDWLTLPSGGRCIVGPEGIGGRTYISWQECCRGLGLKSEFTACSLSSLLKTLTDLRASGHDMSEEWSGCDDGTIETDLVRIYSDVRGENET